MNREKLLNRLARLRELQLYAQVSDLKTHSGALSRLKRFGEQARAVASESIERAHHLGDLRLLGEARLRSIRMAAEVEGQIRVLTDGVGRARKLAETAHAARTNLKRAREGARERSLELESEAALNWSKGAKSER
jgi:hypothetical protein